MLKEFLRYAPGVKGVLRRRHRRHFLSEQGYASHYGVYRSFAEARSDAPPSAEFDQVALASEYTDRLERVFAYDYPVMLWLDKAMRAGARRVVDVGGNIGVHFFAYRHFFDYPPDLVWTVCEVPAIAEAGREMMRDRGEPGLEFTSEFTPGLVEQADVLISAGTLHYIEQPLLWDLLSAALRWPEHVLLNKVPLYQGETFVTLQNIRRGYAPSWVWNRSEFLGAFQRQGYRAADGWSVPERHFWLPGHPERTFGAYSGVYLQRC
jgi:putative methyltransferase (TIGR04325 family)